jgi:hypothetical protein
MFALAIPVVIGLAILLGVMLALPGGEAGRELQSLSQLQQYRAFLYAAARYFEQTAAPATTTAYGWTVIKDAAPPSLRNAGMPPHWKSVRRPDGSWVVCTELAETTLARLPALFPVQTVAVGTASIAVLPTVVPTGSITALVGNGGASQPGTPSYVVMGQQDAQAAASANLCAGT